MSIHEINPSNTDKGNKKVLDKLIVFNELVNELNKKEIPFLLEKVINEEILSLNFFIDSDKELMQKLGKVQYRIVTLVEKELQLVPKNYHRNRWMAFGMGAFGIPFGIAFGFALGNLAFLGIGIPIGLAIGIAVGSAKDKKVQQEGKQLNVVLKN